jgi:hypothetical protein
MRAAGDDETGERKHGARLVANGRRGAEAFLPINGVTHRWRPSALGTIEKTMEQPTTQPSREVGIISFGSLFSNG